MVIDVIEHLRESRMDTSQPHQTIQSTTEIDDGQKDLERQLKIKIHKKIKMK